MTPDERRLLVELFDRLEAAEPHSRDPEVEREIINGLRRAPHAAYAMAQTILAQNMAMDQAAQRIRALEDQVARLDQGRSASVAPDSRPDPWRYPSASGQPMGAPGDYGRGSVPSFGGPQGYPGQPGGYAGQQPGYGQPGYAQPGFGQGGNLGPAQAQGGSFLGSAARVAMGVAGGFLAYEAAKSLFGGGAAHAAGDAGASALSGAASGVDPGGIIGSDLGSQISNPGSGAAETAAAAGGGGLLGWLWGGGSGGDSKAAEPAPAAPADQSAGLDDATYDDSADDGDWGGDDGGDSYA